MAERHISLRSKTKQNKNNKNPRQNKMNACMFDIHTERMCDNIYAVLHSAIFMQTDAAEIEKKLCLA